MNDGDREGWVDNDEGLYDLWRLSGQSKRTFVRTNRALIDQVVGAVQSGAKPQHYLKYGVGR